MKWREYTKGWTWLPRRAVPNDNYQFDFDGSERYSRPKTGLDKWPYPPIIGSLSGFWRQQDQMVWDGMFGKMPSGPGATTVPINLQWQIEIPGLTKV